MSAPPPPPGPPGAAASATAPAPAAARGGRRWWAGYIALPALLLGLVLAVATVVAGMRSERYGVTMTFVAVGPLAFGSVGTLVALLTRRSRSGVVAVAAPLGCGCASAAFALLLAFLFFGLIWPRL